MKRSDEIPRWAAPLLAILYGLSTAGGLFILVLLAWLSIGTARAQLPDTYLGGDFDTVTPDVRLVSIAIPPQFDEPLLVTLRITDFDNCGPCQVQLPDGYGQEGQIDGEGHAHVYFQRLTGRIPDSRRSDVLCVFHSGNPTVKQIEPNVWRAECPRPAPGHYRVCAELQRNDHVARGKAHPRDFPPVDCDDLTLFPEDTEDD